VPIWAREASRLVFRHAMFPGYDDGRPDPSVKCVERDAGFTLPSRVTAASVLEKAAGQAHQGLGTCTYRFSRYPR